MNIPMKFYDKILLYTAIGALVSTSFGCHVREQEEEKPVDGEIRSVTFEPGVMETMGIKVTEAQRRVLHEWVETIGSFAADPSEVLSVRSRWEGKILRLHAQAGDTVRRGDLLAQVRTGGKGSIPILHDVRAPISGMVMGAFVSPGDRVDASSALFSIGDLSILRLSIDIYEKDIGRVLKGQLCEGSVPAYPGKVFSGRITYISPRVDEETRTIKARVDVENPKGELRLGMMAWVRIAVNTSEVLAVPSSTIQKIQGETSVFVTQDGRTFYPRAISTGIKSDEFTEIRSGLEPGDKVVFQGAFTLKSELLKHTFGEED